MNPLPWIGFAACLLAALWPALPACLPSRIVSSLLSRAAWLPALSPWARGAALPYALLLAGVVTARGFGLAGGDLIAWGAGALAAAGFGLAGGWLSARKEAPPEWEWFLAEARWSMYRSAALWFLPLGWPAAAAGALGAALELGAGWIRARGRLDDRAVLSHLARTAASAAVYLVAANFYLAIALYALASVSSRRLFGRGRPATADG